MAEDQRVDAGEFDQETEIDTGRSADSAEETNVGINSARLPDEKGEYEEVSTIGEGEDIEGTEADDNAYAQKNFDQVYNLNPEEGEEVEGDYEETEERYGEAVEHGSHTDGMDEPTELSPHLNGENERASRIENLEQSEQGEENEDEQSVRSAERDSGENYEEESIGSNEHEKQMENDEQEKPTENAEQEEPIDSEEQVEPAENEEQVEPDEQENFEQDDISHDDAEEERAGSQLSQSQAEQSGDKLTNQRSDQELHNQDQKQEGRASETPPRSLRRTPAQSSVAVGEGASRFSEPSTFDPGASTRVAPRSAGSVGSGSSAGSRLGVGEIEGGAVKYDDSAAATVRFLLLPSQQVTTVRCFLSQTLAALKEQFAPELKLPVDVILLLLDGKILKDTTTLGALGVCENGTIQLTMQSADPINQPIRVFRPRQEYHMPDVITVRVPIGARQTRDIVVEITRPTGRKPFLGGYRHKQTGVEFHHAGSQTIPRLRPPPDAPTYCRDTQTALVKMAVQQTAITTATQMGGPGLAVSTVGDRLVAPRGYVTADQRRELICAKVLVIQKYYRRWLARRRVARIRDNERRRREWQEGEAARRREEREGRVRREFERRMHPRSKHDFDLVYHALEQWRGGEIERIDSTLSGAERKAALCILLDQEAQLIGTISRHKNDADLENKNKNIDEFLDKAAQPKTWTGPDGKVTSMDTPETRRAQALKETYRTLTFTHLTQDERRDVLLTLKNTVKEHDCKLTRDIVELIDREAELLLRGVPSSHLDGLRKRISTLFLQYIRIPAFNPEAARVLKVPQDPSTLSGNIHQCPSCSQYLPSADFPLSSGSQSVGRCRRCVARTNDACARSDQANYRYMLRAVRRAEAGAGGSAGAGGARGAAGGAAASTVAFLMQESDVRFLVESIWGSQSALSACEDAYELVLVRWARAEEWAPWNCVLLTRDEAAAHLKLDNLDEAYGAEFLHRVRNKHTLARNHFARVPAMAAHMRAQSAAEARKSAASSAPLVQGKRVATTGSTAATRVC